MKKNRIVHSVKVFEDGGVEEFIRSLGGQENIDVFVEDSSIYKFFFTKDKLNYFKKIKIYHLSHFIILVGISIVSAIIYHVLIDNKNISHIIPILSPTIILITLIISFFIYEEHLEIHEIFGILLIILGIIIVKSKTFLTND